MNQWLNRLERRFGKHAVPHLSAVMIGCYVIGYLLEFANRSIVSYMTLEPALILRGQIWRLVTWVIIPPSSFSIWTIIMLLFYLSIGTSLERAWGDFRYNVYIFGGMLITVIAAFVCYFGFSAYMGGAVSIGAAFSTYYICMSIFLAFAATFPDAQVMLYFVIPIRVKWLGVLYAAFLAYDCVEYFRYIAAGQVLAWVYIIALLASLCNFFIFFFSSRRGSHVHLNRQERRERKNFRQAAAKNRPPVQMRAPDGGRVPRHRCEICGRTDVSNPELEFRFCSKCKGAHEYCSDHLFTHKHIT